MKIIEHVIIEKNKRSYAWALEDVKTNHIDCINIKDLYKTIKNNEAQRTSGLSLEEQVDIVDMLYLENITDKKQSIRTLFAI